MSYKHRREPKSSSLSHQDKAKLAIRQGLNKSSTTVSNEPKSSFNFHLYENDRQERIDQIADDDDGDLVLERRIPTNYTEKTSRIIEANDRRHDAVIFGDKKTEDQQKNKLWDSFKQSSKYSTTSLAGPLLLEDLETKRLRWKTKMRQLWIQRYGNKTTTANKDTD